ncbi:hypothetical protein GLAREA_02797 [Glarea lozoyensis ATCC 20868]|uniref:Uncharacterized protein n=1 Tax=Glarea lozoyensis (strain ATCC 20868 / MF5171) TaxID=1116229 RepID=S3DK17_GLAL2|nr:uncharacterized protein GLAREA_02797 [Glarea lozoyensis ATCC 20868]EPE26883.1 hypothetical protein GLAREA_02797 [Glarea lozoyensis ATCC 20868]
MASTNTNAAAPSPLAMEDPQGKLTTGTPNDAQLKEEEAILLKKDMAKKAAGAVIVNTKPTHPDSAREALKDRPEDAI